MAWHRMPKTSSSNVHHPSERLVSADGVEDWTKATVKNNVKNKMEPMPGQPTKRGDDSQRFTPVSAARYWMLSPQLERNSCYSTKYIVAYWADVHLTLETRPRAPRMYRSTEYVQSMDTATGYLVLAGTVLLYLLLSIHVVWLSSSLPSLVVEASCLFALLSHKAGKQSRRTLDSNRNTKYSVLCHVIHIQHSSSTSQRTRLDGVYLPMYVLSNNFSNHRSFICIRDSECFAGHSRLAPD